MPRTPITIRVVPSRLAWWSQALLSSAVLVMMASFAAAWLVALAGLWLVWLLWRLRSDDPGGELRWQPEATGSGSWHWCPAPDGEARRVSLRCCYLGPCLIGLCLGRQRLWLWPDSSDRESLRALRRWLVQHA